MQALQERRRRVTDVERARGRRRAEPRLDVARRLAGAARGRVHERQSVNPDASVGGRDRRETDRDAEAVGERERAAGAVAHHARVATASALGDRFALGERAPGHGRVAGVREMHLGHAFEDLGRDGLGDADLGTADVGPLLVGNDRDADGRGGRALQHWRGRQRRRGRRV
jgi:hypothetical protein